MEQANTLTLPEDLNCFRAMGFVPKTTFLQVLSFPKDKYYSKILIINITKRWKLQVNQILPITNKFIRQHVYSL